MNGSCHHARNCSSYHCAHLGLQLPIDLPSNVVRHPLLTQNPHFHLLSATTALQNRQAVDFDVSIRHVFVAVWRISGCLARKLGIACSMHLPAIYKVSQSLVPTPYNAHVIRSPAVSNRTTTLRLLALRRLTPTLYSSVDKLSLYRVRSFLLNNPTSLLVQPAMKTCSHLCVQIEITVLWIL
ncbi:hypothetical protein BDQ17DRAFT_1364455, partial [Cyathus striatus]